MKKIINLDTLAVAVTATVLAMATHNVLDYIAKL